MPEHSALDAMTVLEKVLTGQSGTVSKDLIKAVYAAALKHQYDAPDENALRDAIRRIVTDYVSAQMDQIDSGVTP